MSHQITIRRNVEFSETDMAGIVHFSNYFRYVEIAEAALFEAAGYPLIQRTRDCAEGWPRVRASCDFREPLYFGNECEVYLEVVELKIKAIEFKFRIHRLDPESDPILVAKGKMTTVYARLLSGGNAMESKTLPPELVKKIAPPGQPDL
jgi:acyl-CoA thioester hydrolase